MPYKDPEIARIKKREYYLNNRDKMISLAKEWEKEHREKVTARKRIARQNMSDEERAIYNLKTRLRYHANKDKESKRKKAYKAKNKHIVNADASKRRAAKLNRTPTWLTEFDLFKMQCFYSIAAMLSRNNQELWVVDHVIPLQGKLVSGLHVPSNLQLMRARSNESKGNKYEIV
jgi:hypothetical protein